ncbi:MAG: AsnC family transcriptional regulator [Gammaproteobacteria bacterium]|nr:MAG: AsnC family transcriptional regulator [Gammaproteobacteria bacterium]
MAKTPEKDRPWTFLSNYAHVLVCLAEDPTARMRDVADKVGITERAAIRIVKHLEEADVLSKQREGRRNRYRINMDKPLRHPIESHDTVRSLLTMILGKSLVRRASA